MRTAVSVSFEVESEKPFVFDFDKFMASQELTTVFKFTAEVSPPGGQFYADAVARNRMLSEEEIKGGAE